MKIYHNPRCSKSRQTLALLEEKGESFEIKEYLNEVPSKEELANILRMLGIPAEKLLRRGEAIFKEEYKGKTLTESQWIGAMIKHPKLIERPIVVKNGKASLGRPPEQVLGIL